MFCLNILSTENEKKIASRIWRQRSGRAALCAGVYDTPRFLERPACLPTAAFCDVTTTIYHNISLPLTKYLGPSTPSPNVWSSLFDQLVSCLKILNFCSVVMDLGWS